jgi:hypothetical protein
MVEQLFGVEKTAHGENTCLCGSEPARDEGSTFNIDGD